MKNQKITKLLNDFKERRDALLHNDDQTFAYDLNRFLSLLNNSEILIDIIEPLIKISEEDFEAWLNQQKEQGFITFPEDEIEENGLRYRYLKFVSKSGDLLNSFSHPFRYSYKDAKATFKSIIIRPFLIYLGDLLSKRAELASKEARDLQAVPLEQVPLKDTTRIFLSHKSIDKPRVRKYYNVLLSLGFEPWLDVEDLSAGDNLERTLSQGFRESCAAVFFITENFQDENFLATEIDYAIREKRAKDKRFALITLRFDKNSKIPELLEIYVWKDVQDDLDGLYEILKALPIELGPVRWKKEVL